MLRGIVSFVIAVLLTITIIGFFHKSASVGGNINPVNQDVYSLSIGGTPVISHDGSFTASGFTVSGAATFSGTTTGLRTPVTITTATTFTVTAAESGTAYLGTKGSGTQTATLPAASTPGLTFTFIAGDAAGELLVNPTGADYFKIKASTATGTSITTATGFGIKNTAATNIVDDYIRLVSDGLSTWYMIGQAGIWASQ